MCFKCLGDRYARNQCWMWESQDVRWQWFITANNTFIIINCISDVYFTRNSLTHPPVPLFILSLVPLYSLSSLSLSLSLFSLLSLSLYYMNDHNTSKKKCVLLFVCIQFSVLCLNFTFYILVSKTENEITIVEHFLYSSTCIKTYMSNILKFSPKILMNLSIMSSVATYLREKTSQQLGTVRIFIFINQNHRIIMNWFEPKKLTLCFKFIFKQHKKKNKGCFVYDESNLLLPHQHSSAWLTSFIHHFAFK